MTEREIIRAEAQMDRLCQGPSGCEEIDAEEQRLTDLVDDYEADLQDRLEDHAEMIEAQERERVYQLRMDLWDQLS